MNLKTLFNSDKLLQTKKIFNAAEGVTVIHLNAGGSFKEHITTIPALLVCIAGEVFFENEKSYSERLLVGDFVNIEPKVKHWLLAEYESTLLLIK